MAVRAEVQRNRNGEAGAGNFTDAELATQRYEHEIAGLGALTAGPPPGVAAVQRCASAESHKLSKMFRGNKGDLFVPGLPWKCRGRYSIASDGTPLEEKKRMKKNNKKSKGKKKGKARHLEGEGEEGNEEEDRVAEEAPPDPYHDDLHRTDCDRGLRSRDDPRRRFR